MRYKFTPFLSSGIQNSIAESSFSFSLDFEVVRASRVRTRLTGRTSRIGLARRLSLHHRHPHPHFGRYRRWPLLCYSVQPTKNLKGCWRYLSPRDAEALELILRHFVWPNFNLRFRHEDVLEVCTVLINDVTSVEAYGKKKLTPKFRFYFYWSGQIYR